MEFLRALWAFIVALFAPKLPPDAPKPSDPPVVSGTPAERIVDEAIKWLGKDPTPQDRVSDEFACVTSLVKVISPVISLDPNLSYSPHLVTTLKGSNFFKAVLTPEAGCIIISPTEGSNRGHAGIMLNESEIVSNTSATGLWAKNYSFEGWVRSFKLKKGLHVYLFKPI